MAENYKAQGMSINVIILMILALIVLVSVAYFFLGGMQKSGGELENASSSVTSGLDPIKTGAKELGHMFDCEKGQHWDTTLKGGAGDCAADAVS